MDEQQFITTFFCRARYDYQSADDATLTFQRDDIIEVLFRLDTGWWDGLLGEERGWFPSNYVNIITDEEADASLAALALQQQQQPQLIPTYSPSSSQPTSTQSTLARSSMAQSRLHNDQSTWPNGDTRNGHKKIPVGSLPDKLHPTLSSWLKNINKLDGLIDRLQEIASSAPIDDRCQLLNKVAALRAMFKEQQVRYIKFLQLSKDYANKYLRDINAEIQQQKTLLDNLEVRLEAAKKLHGDAIDLRMLYESGTVASMNDLRATGKAVSVVCRGCKANH